MSETELSPISPIHPYDTDHSPFSSGFSAGFCSVKNLAIGFIIQPRIHAEQYQQCYPRKAFSICAFLCSYKAEDACRTRGDLPMSLRPQQVTHHTCSSAAAGPPTSWSSVKSSFLSTNHIAHTTVPLTLQGHWVLCTRTQQDGGN